MLSKATLNLRTVLLFIVVTLIGVGILSIVTGEKSSAAETGATQGTYVCDMDKYGVIRCVKEPGGPRNTGTGSVLKSGAATFILGPGTQGYKCIVERGSVCCRGSGGYTCSP